ncbi:hypothetical protein ACDF64_06610 [Agromyces sp. MMS24-JH15]|uniref:hypothetical protein n=1 Tax=Agromyces sp. MMS24-JH15 TaxID=3243765 RepID=UPI00374A7091
MDGLEVANLALEIIGWVGVAGGIVALAVALVVHAADNGWAETSVVVVDDDERGAVVRWLDSEGMHEHELSEHEHGALGDPDEAVAWTNTGGRIRFERRSHALRVWWMIALLLLGIGVVSLVVSLVISLTAS